MIFVLLLFVRAHVFGPVVLVLLVLFFTNLTMTMAIKTDTYLPSLDRHLWSWDAEFEGQLCK